VAALLFSVFLAQPQSRVVIVGADWFEITRGLLDRVMALVQLLTRLSHSA